MPPKTQIYPTNYKKFFSFTFILDLSYDRNSRVLDDFPFSRSKKEITTYLMTQWAVKRIRIENDLSYIVGSLLKVENGAV